jgi:glycosyltransferase involved in cell wall biosynthesis
MRIAFVYDALYPETKGGVERRVWELARLLTKQGNQVELLVPKLWDGPAVVQREGVVLRGVSPGLGLYRRSGRRAVVPSLRHAWGVYRALRHHDYEIVDCQVPAHLACLASRMALRSTPRSHQVVTWHEAWGRHWLEEYGALGHVGRWVEGSVARLPASHVAVSNDTAVAMREVGVVPDRIIEAGVDWQTIAGVAPRPIADVVFVGRLIPTKNLGLLLDAFRSLANSGQSVSLCVVGDGPSRVSLERRTAELGLDSQVSFVGALPDWLSVVAVVKGARLLAMPSLREGFGLVALEAAACGTPVVTVDHPRNAVRELVEHGRTGLVVPPTTHDLAEGIKTLIEDERRRVEMGERARERAIASGWGQTVSETLNVYERVAV